MNKRIAGQTTFVSTDILPSLPRDTVRSIMLHQCHMENEVSEGDILWVCKNCKGLVWVSEDVDRIGFELETDMTLFITARQGPAD